MQLQNIGYNTIIIEILIRLKLLVFDKNDPITKAERPVM